MTFSVRGFIIGKKNLMKVDRLDEELESKLLCELDFIVEQLRGKITKSVYANSEGKQSKVITIEYDVRDKNEDTI